MVNLQTAQSPSNKTFQAIVTTHAHFFTSALRCTLKHLRRKNKQHNNSPKQLSLYMVAPVL